MGHSDWSLMEARLIAGRYKGDLAGRLLGSILLPQFQMPLFESFKERFHIFRLIRIGNQERRPGIFPFADEIKSF